MVGSWVVLGVLRLLVPGSWLRQHCYSSRQEYLVSISSWRLTLDLSVIAGTMAGRYPATAFISIGLILLNLAAWIVLVRHKGLSSDLIQSRFEFGLAAYVI